MTTPLRKLDMDVVRAEHAAFEARCEELLGTGQKLLARIRPTSKYFGQGEEGGLFPVVVANKGEYGVVGGATLTRDTGTPAEAATWIVEQWENVKPWG